MNGKSKIVYLSTIEKAAPPQKRKHGGSNEDVTPFIGGGNLVAKTESPPVTVAEMEDYPAPPSVQMVGDYAPPPSVMMVGKYKIHSNGLG